MEKEKDYKITILHDLINVCLVAMTSHQTDPNARMESANLILETWDRRIRKTLKISSSNTTKELKAGRLSDQEEDVIAVMADVLTQPKLSSMIETKRHCRQVFRKTLELISKQQS